MKKRIRCCLLLGFLVLVSCGKQIPKEIIQPQQMEKVLYDYHLVSGMSQNISVIERESYRNYVFQKHGVTKAEFDSSMVWYTRKSSELAEIYKNISERFQREEGYVNLLMGDQQTDDRISEPGDSVDLWMNAPLLWLTDAPLSNHVQFEIKSDSNFYPKDRVTWSADYILLSSSRVTMGMNMVFDNDSVLGKMITFTQSGEQTLDLRTDSTWKMRSMNGFVFVQSDSSQTSSVLVNDISLMRYHTVSDSALMEKLQTVPFSQNENKEITHR